MLDKQFELYYHQIRTKQKRDALMWSGLLVVLYLSSGYFAEFSLLKVIKSAPNFLDYLADTMPVLKWEVLFSGRDSQGHAIIGSFIYWGYRLPIQLPLLLETFCVAIAATVLPALIACFLSFFCANNTSDTTGVRWAVRSFVAFLRTMPELAWAVMFVMAYGVGALPGFLALALHTVGSLTKLFYESIETTSDDPVKGLTACGGNHWQNARFAIWPQVKPIFMSYSFLRLEVNFRSSTILGLVGAGGIGQELMTNIKLDRYDQVSMTLLLIIIVVAILDSLSGYLRNKVLGKI